MPSNETPPNSPSVLTEMSENEEDEFLDENDVVEIINEDEMMVNNSEEEDDKDEEEDIFSERDDALVVFKEHQEGILCCHFHPKLNNIVATGGIDDNAIIWDSTNGNKLFTCKGHEDSVEVVSFSHDGSYLATADLTGVIKIWRTKDFLLIETFELEDELSWMQWHYGTNVLVASSQIGMIFMYKIPSGERKMIMAGFGQNCLSGKILPDGKSLACGYKDGSLKIADLKAGTILKEVKPCEELGGISCLDAHRNNNLIICGCETGAVILINSNSGKMAAVLQSIQNSEGSSYIEGVAFCKDPSYPVAASGSLDGSLVIWDIIKQTLRHKYKFSSCLNHLAWHPTLPILLTCHFEGVARVYDAKAGVILKEYLGHQKSCLNMSLSSDGSLLVTASEDKTARIFSVNNILNK